MFSQPAYNLFLGFVVKHWGTSRFAGVMKAFHLNPQLLVSDVMCDRSGDRSGLCRVC